jgi:hypothetical protein
MHKLAPWVEHAASDVLFVETRHALGMSTVARCPGLVGDDSRGESRDTHRREEVDSGRSPGAPGGSQPQLLLACTSAPGGGEGTRERDSEALLQRQ